MLDLLQQTVPEQAQPVQDGPAPDMRPGASDGLSPSVVQALSDARQGGLQQLFGADWEAAGTRLEAAYRLEGPAAYERLTQSPGSFGAVTGDPRHAPTVAGGLYAREQVLAEARGATPVGTSRSPEPVSEGPALTRQPQPSAWVGTDGQPVRLARAANGFIELSPNASPSLQRYAGYVASARSQVATAAFEELSFGPTRLNLRLGAPGERPDLNGLHQAHDARGPIPWDARSGDETRGRFERMPDYVTDPRDGSRAYREATITIFETNLSYEDAQAISRRYGDGSLLSREDAQLAVFLHEAFHDTDNQTVSAIETRMRGGTDRYGVETEAYNRMRQFLAEIQGRPR